MEQANCCWKEQVFKKMVWFVDGPQTGAWWTYDLRARKTSKRGHWWGTWFSFSAPQITAVCLEYYFLEHMLTCNLQVGYGASFVEFFAEEAKRVYGDIIPPTLPDRRLFVVKQVNGFESLISFYVSLSTMHSLMLLWTII